MAQLQSTSITGSLIVTQGITGSFSGSITNAVSASYAATASYALNAGDSIWTGSSGNIYYSGGNVGIGITNPGYRLEVNGGTGAASGNIARFTLGGAGGGTRGLTMYSDGSQLKLQVTDNVGNYGTWAYLNLNPDGGNVGIGITNPGAELHIQGTSTEQVLISYDSTRRMIMGRTTGYGWISPYTNGVSYDNLVLVRDGGNVGIGTTNPTETLSISGTSTSGVGISLANGDGTGGRILADNSSLYFYSNSGTLVYSLKNSKIRLNDGNGGTIGVELGSGGSISQNGNGGGLTFSDTTAYLSNGLVVSAGNVGIGTTSPGYKLDVNGDTNITGNLYFNSNSTLQPARRYVSTANLSSAGYTVIGTVTGDALASSIRISLQGTTNSTVINVMADILVNHYQDILITSYAGMYTTLTLRVVSNNNEIYSIEATTDSAFACTTYIEIFPLNSETVVFGGSAQTGTSLTHPCVPGMNVSATGGTSGNLAVGGNVGIGTTSPGYKLEVGGTLGVSGNATFNGGNVYINSDYSYIGNNTTDLVSLSGGTVYLPGNGNVGIGTTSPGYKLDVVASSNSTYPFIVRNAGNAEIGGIYSTSAGAGQLYLFNASSAATAKISTIDASYFTGGNVGIGTTNPSTTLDVAGGIISTGTYQARMIGGAGGAYFGSMASIPVIFQVNQAEVGRFNESGNLGVGTSSPTSLLHVYNNADVWHTRIGGASGELRIGGQTASGAVIQAYTPAGSVRDLYIQRDGGNVGIGTSSPTATLQINGAGGDTAPTLRLISTASDTFNWASSTQHANLTAGETSIHLIGKANSQYNQAYFGYRHVSDGSSSNMVTIGMYASDYLLNILGNGNVGIGTTSPGYKLNVIGTLGVTGDTTIGGNIAGARTLNLISSDNAVTYDINFQQYGTSVFGRIRYEEAASDFQFYAKSDTDPNLTLQWGGNSYFQRGNVGIGTTSPAYKLDVNGTGRFSGRLYADSNVTLSGYIQPSSNVGYGVKSSNGTILQEWYDGAIYNYGTSYFNGNVGIGTTSPSAKLQTVSSGLGDGGGIRITNSGAGGDDYRIWPTATVNGEGAGKLIFTNNGGNVLTLTSGGNVGIGTTSPTSRLEVGNFLDAFTNSITVSGRYEYVPQFTFRLGQSGTNLDWTGGVISCGDDGNYNGIIYFKTANAGRDTPTTKMVIKASGNVGIGTVNPAQKLDVIGQAIIGSGAQAIVGTDGTYAGYSTIGFGGATNGYNRVFGYNGTGDGLYLAAATGRGIEFWTNGTSTPRMFITSGGNVGIGTTNPTGKLTISQNNSGGVAALTFTEDESTIQGPSANTKILMGGNLSLNAASIWIAGTNGSERMRITSDGNVGIGTTSPAFPLHVARSSGDSVIVADSGASANAQFRFQEAGALAAAITFVSSDDSLRFYNGGDRFTILSNGNVGIGTTSPGYKLHVEGTSWFTNEQAISYTNSIQTMYGGTGYSLFRMYGNSNGVEMQIDAHSHNSGAATIGTYSNSDVFIKTNQTNRMVVKADGNVGIGTTSPSQLLHVAGKIYSITSGTDGGEIRLANSGGGSTWYWAARTTGLNLGELGAADGRIFIANGGNVGIGITNPAAKLDVVGAAGLLVKIAASGGQIGGLYADSTQVALTENGGSSAYAIYPSSNVLALSTNATERMRITSGGNVGIGVTAPAAKLQVSGSSNVLNVRGSGSATTSSIFSVDGNNGRLFEVSDDLSNSLFSVNTIAGLPVIEAFADYTVTMGTYGAYTLQVTGSRVGVGTSSPGYPLHVSGSVSGISIYATNDIAAFSDQSVKTDLQVIDSAVDRIKQINGYTYVRVDDLSNTRRAGVIAQEVQKVLPEVVSENTDGTLNVAYSNMIALLIEGMKEQQSQIDKLREDLEDLRYEL